MLITVCWLFGRPTAQNMCSTISSAFDLTIVDPAERSREHVPGFGAR
jgi:hypothetical protein